MERGLPAPAMRFFRGQTCIFMPTFVEKLVRAVRQIAPSQCRDSINHLPHFELACADCFFGLFAFSNVCAGRVPSNDSSLLVQQRVVTDKKPAIFAILPQCSLLIFER